MQVSWGITVILKDICCYLSRYFTTIWKLKAFCWSHGWEHVLTHGCRYLSVDSKCRRPSLTYFHFKSNPLKVKILFQEKSFRLAWVLLRLRLLSLLQCLLYLFFSRLSNYCTHVISIRFSIVEEDKEREILKFHHLFLHPNGLRDSRLHNHNRGKSHLSGGKDEMRTDTCCNSVSHSSLLRLALRSESYNSMMKRIVKEETSGSKSHGIRNTKLQ